MKRKDKKKILNVVIGIVIVLLVVGAMVAARTSATSKVYGDDEIQMHFFHARTCPHCHAQKRIHPALEEKYPNLNIIEYETSLGSTTKKLQEFAAKYPDQLDLSRFGTPTTIIGDRVQIGFNEASTPSTLNEMIRSEQGRIDTGWDEATMTRTIDL